MRVSKKVVIGAAAAAFTIASGTAFAGGHGAYPSKPIKIVVGFLLVVERIRPLVALHHSCTKPRAWLDSPHILSTFPVHRVRRVPSRFLVKSRWPHTLHDQHRHLYRW